MDIVRQIRKDAEKGVKILEHEFKERLMVIALRLCTDHSEAEALVWRTIDETVRHIGSLNNPDSLFSWMSSIMVRINSSSSRRMSNSKISCSGNPPEASDEMAGVDRLVSEIDSEILHKAVDGLPDKLRESVVLHYFMDIPLLRNARVEVDFALTTTDQESGARLFGADYHHKKLGLAYSAYVTQPNSVFGGGRGWAYIVGDAVSYANPWPKTSSSEYIALDTARHTLVFDYTNRVCCFITGSTTNSTYQFAAKLTNRVEACAHPMSLFAVYSWHPTVRPERRGIFLADGRTTIRSAPATTTKVSVSATANGTWR